MIRLATVVCFSLVLLVQKIVAQQPTTPPPAPPAGPSMTPTVLPVADSITVTVVLKHQQDKNMTEIRRKLEANGFWDLFPPKEARVISWNIVMGLGHVITLRLPANEIRALNLAIQNGAWGAYDTEIYMTYDYLPFWYEYMEKRAEVKDENEKN